MYSQQLDYGFGNAERHPIAEHYNSINSLKNAFLLMSRSGNPEGTSLIDKEATTAYIRLWGDSDKVSSDEFKNKFAVGTDNLAGYYVFPYAASTIHRRIGWAAIIKGYSKNVWASEIYVNANRYGRYRSNFGDNGVFGMKLNESKGDYDSAWIEHSMAPENASYQYVIYPGLQEGEADSFGNKVKNDKFNQIVKKDNVVHIVKENEAATAEFVIFDSAKELDNDILKSVLVSSLLMIKNEASTITGRGIQPDLNFLEGKGGYSMPVELPITLKGNRKL